MVISSMPQMSSSVPRRPNFAVRRQRSGPLGRPGHENHPTIILQVASLIRNLNVWPRLCSFLSSKNTSGGIPKYVKNKNDQTDSLAAGDGPAVVFVDISTEMSPKCHCIGPRGRHLCYPGDLTCADIRHFWTADIFRRKSA